VNLEAAIEGRWWQICWPCLSELGNTVGGSDWVSMEMHTNTLIDRNSMNTYMWLIDPAPDFETRLISELTHHHGNVAR
jgi:hypothetical protein